MFTIDQNITDLNIKERNIVKVFLSMNIHQVATPEMVPEGARSYVFFFREGKKRLSAYIGLHFPQTDRKLFYVHSANPFLEDEMQNIEDEARNFAEDLGAMLDEIHLENMSDLEQDGWIDDQGIFSRKKQPETAPVEQPPRPSVIAAAVPAVQPQPASAPGPPTAPAQPGPQTLPSQAVVKEQQQAPVPAPVQQNDQTKAAQLAETARKQQEIMQKAIKEGIAKPPKQTAKKEAPSSAGLVSRDREALARLLTSF